MAKTNVYFYIACSLGLLLFSVKTAFNYIKRLKKMNFLTAVNELTPKMLEEEIKKINLFRKEYQGRILSKDQIKNLDFKNKLVVIPNCLIKGISQNLRDFNYENVYEKIEKKKRYRFAFLNLNGKGKSGIIWRESKCNFFKLKEKSSDLSCYVASNDNVDCKLRMSHKVINTEIKFNSLQNFLCFTSSVIYFIFSFLKLPFFSKNIVTGYEDNIYYLKMGTEFIVFGDVLYDLTTQKMRIDYPLKFLVSKQQWISKIEKKMHGKIVTIFFCMGLSIVFAYMAYKISFKGRGFQNKVILNEISTNSEDFKCLDCKFYQKNIILNPCSHLVLCKDCYEKRKDPNKKCPLCLENYTDFIEIHIP